MKFRDVLLSCAAFFYCQLFGLSTWQKPDPRLRYHEVSFFTSHNSYAAKNHGYFYAQQKWSLKEQLHAGIRGLMLDTHLHAQSGEIILCHRNEWINKIICGGKPAMKFDDALKVIQEFLASEPSEVITIFLENYVKNKQLVDQSLSTAGLDPYILAPEHWDPISEQGWPTLDWMQKNNKRLIIFNSIEETKLTFYQWEHVIENQWGALPCRHACKERHESRAHRLRNRYLYVINYFPRLKMNFGGSYERINSRDLDILLQQINNGLGNEYCKGRLPNFVSLDFVDEGDGLKRVNIINEELHKKYLCKT